MGITIRGTCGHKHVRGSSYVCRTCGYVNYKRGRQSVRLRNGEKAHQGRSGPHPLVEGLRNGIFERIGLYLSIGQIHCRVTMARQLHTSIQRYPLLCETRNEGVS